LSKPKDYQKAIKYFDKCKENLPVYQELPKKAMHLRCLYEMKIWNDEKGIAKMNRLQKRYERYLYNYPKGISNEKCESYKKLFQLTATLFRYQANQINYPKENILDKIKAAKCMNYDWLIDKYNEL